MGIRRRLWPRRAVQLEVSRRAPHGRDQTTLLGSGAAAETIEIRSPPPASSVELTVEAARIVSGRRYRFSVQLSLADLEALVERAKRHAENP